MASTTFWTKQQDARCVEQYNELKQQVEALGKVVDDLAAENGKLREELQTRSKVWDDDLSAMESRVITRMEGIEDRLTQGVDYSEDEGKKGESVGGRLPWTQRKAAAAAAERSDEVWKKKPVAKPTTPVAEEK